MDIAERLIERWRKKDFFIVVHFNEPDKTGHKDGVNSETYERVILKNDEELGKILDLLAGHGILEETQIYILSDHGFGTPEPHGHDYAPNTFITSNDVGMTDIYMVDVADFLLSNFGLGS